MPSFCNLVLARQVSQQPETFGWRQKAFTGIDQQGILQMWSWRLVCMNTVAAASVAVAGDESPRNFDIFINWSETMDKAFTPGIDWRGILWMWVWSWRLVCYNTVLSKSVAVTGGESPRNFDIFINWLETMGNAFTALNMGLKLTSCLLQHSSKSAAVTGGDSP